MSRRLAVIFALVLTSIVQAHEPPAGRLLIVGGGSLKEDALIFQRLVEYAGGPQRAQIAVIPTASLGPPDAIYFTQIMARWKVTREQVHLINVTSTNAKEQAFNPDIVDRLKNCNGVYFQGGDQNRLMGALVQDGKETPVLTAIRAVWQRGGVIAGSSAGAAVQSAKMISVAGLPNDSFDEGLDALDFGVTHNVARRGVLVTTGLGFFQGGIIDQHFNQYRGRLGRLARAVSEGRVRYGFGIDEQTALDVAPDGSFEVLGEGIVTVVDMDKAICVDGPLGCRLTNVRLSCLKAHDHFDPSTGTAKIVPEKAPVTPGMEAFNGNFLIPDISARGAVATALFMGLGDNTSRKQVGITLKHHQPSAHGYRYTFQKIADTKYLEGVVKGVATNSLLNVQLDIEPIDGMLKAPDTHLPADLPAAPSPERTILTALWRRGILLEDEEHRLRPQEHITRAELAGLIAQTIRLELPRRGHHPPIDVAADSPWNEAIGLVVGNQLLDVDGTNAFRPNEHITREAAATVLVRLMERYHQHPLPTDQDPELPPAERRQIALVHRPAVATALRLSLMKAQPGGFFPKEHLTRMEAAAAIYAIIGFHWTESAPQLATPAATAPMSGQER